MKHNGSILRFRRLGINTLHEHIVYMREDCPVCLAEGFEILTRICVSKGKNTIVAIVNIVKTDIIQHGEISLSEKAMHSLGVKDGDMLHLSHLQPLESLGFVRSKIFGNDLNAPQMDMIIRDIVNGSYSNIHLAAFITSCAGNRMNTSEIIALTNAMIATGHTILWDKELIVDKHCIGGLPGNRTTPIIVSIVTAFGLTMPKTSSRAITSPAGTADTMEVITNVNLSLSKMRHVVNKEGGCLVWGGSAGLSPADDILIKIEKALDIDSEGQLIASVLSKKIAAGSRNIIIDIPVGETAKLRNIDAANNLKVEMEKVAHSIGMKLKVVITDGSQPVGRGIGPVLEAIDVLSVLRNEQDAPRDLKERALLLAGEVLELSGKVDQGAGNEIARELLESGKAYEKFVAICLAQGDFREPVRAKFRHEITAQYDGQIKSIDNRRLSRLAKLSGAPEDKAAGIEYCAPVGKRVIKGQTLFVIHSNSEGALNYALSYYNMQQDIILYG